MIDMPKVAVSRLHVRRVQHLCAGAFVALLSACAAVPPEPPPPGPVGARPGLWRFQQTGPSWGLDAVPTNLSGITWSPASQSWFLIQNDDAIVYEYASDLRTLRRRIQLVDAPDDDFEGIAHLGGAEFALATEKNRILIVSMPPGAIDIEFSVDPDLPEVQLLELPERGSWNSGFEALCFDRTAGPRGTLFALQEKKPRRIYRIERPAFATDVDARGGGGIVFDEPFDAERMLEGVTDDLSGCEWDPQSGHLLAVSHQSSKLVELALDGRVVAERPLPGIFRGGASQYEGIAFGPDGQLALVSEPLFGTWPSRVLLFRLQP